MCALIKEASVDALVDAASALDPSEASSLSDLFTHGLLTSDGGSIFGGKLAHLGYGAGLLKLHDVLKTRYKQKLLDELTGVLHKTRFIP